MKISIYLAVFICLSGSQQALAQNSTKCDAIIKSPQEAADHADWIIEGDVDKFIKVYPTRDRVEVLIDNAKVLFEREKSPKFFTASLEADACFPNMMNALWGKNAEKMVGKRVRFFGTRASGRGRRFFFIQPADVASPALPAASHAYVDRKHAPHASVASQAGWARAYSTEGRFSIEMPETFVDMTKGSGEQPAFILRGTNKEGIMFIAAFERSGPGSGIGASFDSSISQPNAKTLIFKGADAVATTGVLPGSNGQKINHGLWFRVPGGTYMLGVAADKSQEKQVLKLKERFFTSLNFE